MKNIEVEEKSSKWIWSEDEIKNLIQTNDKVLYGALKNFTPARQKMNKIQTALKSITEWGLTGSTHLFSLASANFSTRRDFLPQTESYCP